MKIFNKNAEDNKTESLSEEQKKIQYKIQKSNHQKY